MDSVQQVSLRNLENIDTRDLVFDLREPIFANTIAFNGSIISDIMDVGGGYLAFNILAGKEKMEMPLILVKGMLDDVQKYLQKDDRIAAIGFLKKMQGQFVIEVTHLDRIPTQEEINNLS